MDKISLQKELSTKSIPPVIKWTGSKRYLMTELVGMIPEDIDRFFDPFVGGGSTLPYFKETPVFAGDAIPELIALWNMIRNDPATLSSGYKERWNRLQAEGQQVYYEVRDSFNLTRNPIDFLFLSRTCANGLIRFNKSGKFNTSFHLTRAGIQPERMGKLIEEWCRTIQFVVFEHADYRETLSIVKANDFVFLDPPYIISGSMYSPFPFDYDAFYGELDRLNTVGARWMLTFDGQIKNPLHDHLIPSKLYKTCLEIKSGLSSFPRMRGVSKEIYESVYTNFEIKRR